MLSLNAFFAVVFVLGVTSIEVMAQGHPHNCSDLYTNNILLPNGTYTIYNQKNEAYQVYCVFHRGWGYTYVSPATQVQVNIDDLYTNTSYVLVRDLRDDGSQNEANISQITRYQQRNLSIQYNAHQGYSAMQNSKMTPYLYVGFVPVNGVSHRGDTQGYNVNGFDVTFVNCDGNPNSYFSFLFNQKHVSPTNYGPTDSVLLHQWVDRARLVPKSQNIPNSFFSFFEIHFGGCGGFGTPAQFPHVTAAALGLRYDISCPTPGKIARGQTTFSSTLYGSDVRYTCDLGYTIKLGDSSRTCTETGRWSGLEPQCGQFPCDSHPCQNGGLCFEVEGRQYVCECMEAFAGTNCENEID